MEILIGEVIVIILLLILGVSPIKIILGIVWLTELFFIVMSVFFIVSFLLLLLTKKTKGEFLRIEDNEGPGTHAVYKIDGEEYDNTFPAEIMFVNKIYKLNKQVNVWQRKGKKINLLFDGYSIIVIAAGLPIFTALAIALKLFLNNVTPYMIS